MPVSAVARQLGVSTATVQKAINNRELRSHLFGAVRRVRPEDLMVYVQARGVRGPPPGEDWGTVGDLVREAAVSRSQAYRLLERLAVPFEVFAGVRYIRRRDIDAFAQMNRSAGTRSPPRRDVKL
jgi:excisionase family DNA binding protein